MAMIAGTLKALNRHKVASENCDKSENASYTLPDTTLVPVPDMPDNAIQKAATNPPPPAAMPMIPNTVSDKY